ncbi:MAG: prenyltransferase/squalene oxidase repeat-containing protein [Limisphaerales bacterium]
MSLRLQLLQVARLAPRLLGDSTGLVRNFYRRQFNTEGAACDRAGCPDLYYSIFALAGCQALGVPVPTERTRAWLASFGDGAGLDFVHLGALARCWAALGSEGVPTGITEALLTRLEAFRQPDGGYEADPKRDHGTAYGAFVALGAYQDLGRTPPRSLDLIRSLQRLKTPDGAWSNVPGLPTGSVNATAGAVTLIRYLGVLVDPLVGDWLLAQIHPRGGFLAVPGSPLPDLLSTATALHALACLERRLPAAVHEVCLDFLDTLWSAEGGFHGHWADDQLDAEYTFYGLLALGHLSL